METLSDLVKRSSAFVSEALTPLSAFYHFHSLEHTKWVVRAAKIIGRASQLTAEQLEIVLIAGWFHDVGYCHGAKYHEERSALIAEVTLMKWGAVKNIIGDVTRAILATQLPQKPSSAIDMVLCDADLAHLGSGQYELHASRLREELENRQGHKFKSERAWSQLNVEFLKSHHYFTDYGKTILERRKRVNLNRIIRQLQVQPAH